MRRGVPFPAAVAAVWLTFASVAGQPGGVVISATETGRLIDVAAGGNLQHALELARGGDVIQLQPGAVYRGPFVLPAKGNAREIVIRTAASEGTGDGQLPPPGNRVTPRHRGALAVLEAAHDYVVTAEPGAGRYRLVGLEIRPARRTFAFNVVELGNGNERSIQELPHDIRIERSYVHGDPALGSRRGVALNGRAMAVVDSYLSDFKEDGADTQAICGWNGPGPFEIINNRLEGAGENIMFGGADPAIPDLVPSDIRIRRNHITKPLEWRRAARGSDWAVKNLIELKNARRVLIEGNIIEHNWPDAQNGFAVLFTVRNQDGGAPWAVIEDVTFTNNIVRAVTSGINLLGRDDNHPSGMAQRIRIANNLFAGIGDPPFGEGDGDGRFLQMLEESSDVIVEQNTILQTGHITLLEGRGHRRFVFRNNIVRHNEFGIFGSGHAPGLDTIGRYLPGALIVGNLFIGGDGSRYPRDNHFVRSIDDVGFVNPGSGDFSLQPASAARRRGAEGRDIGADLAIIVAATSRVIEGTQDGSDERRPAPCDDLTREPALAQPGCPERP